MSAIAGGGASHQSHYYHHHYYYPHHTIFDTRYFSRYDAPRSPEQQRSDIGFHELGKIGYI